MEQITNLNVTNRLRVPKNVNLRTINGQSLVACGDCPDDIVVAQSPYGSFYDTTTQSVAQNGIAAIKLNNTDLNRDVYVVNNTSSNPTRILFGVAGIYNIQFSAQIYRASGGSSKQVVIWLRKNGIDLHDTATHIAVQANARYLVAAWNFFAEVRADEYIEIMWTQDDEITLAYEPAHTTAPVYPEVPSVIVTVAYVSTGGYSPGIRSGTDVLIDGGTFLTPTNSVLIDGGIF
jgi:hypothetical protein